MVHRQSFGRRAPAARPALSRSPVSAAPAEKANGDIGWVEHTDRELEEWQRQRRRTLPWRQLSLMASLCFGVASLVLPDSVNTAVQWPLYGLAAISFIAGLRRA
jgi:hypothetical protein